MQGAMERRRMLLRVPEHLHDNVAGRADLMEAWKLRRRDADSSVSFWRLESTGGRVLAAGRFSWPFGIITRPGNPGFGLQDPPQGKGSLRVATSTSEGGLSSEERCSVMSENAALLEYYDMASRNDNGSQKMWSYAGGDDRGDRPPVSARTVHYYVTLQEAGWRRRMDSFGVLGQMVGERNQA